MVILHTVKTGGTAIAAWLERHVRVRVYRERHLRRRRLLKMLQGHHGLDVVIGHNVPLIDTALARFVLTIRDPADWLVSVYHTDRTRRGGGETFEAWYNRPGSNAVLPDPPLRNRFQNHLHRWFGSRGIKDMAEQIERRMWHVCDTATLSEDIKPIADAFGIPADLRPVRVAGTWDEEWGVDIARDYTLTPAMRARIYRENPLDVKLYRRLRKLRDRRMAAYRPRELV